MELEELVARDKDDYVELAVNLSNDIERLEHLRAELRDKMANSSVCNGQRFAYGFTKMMQMQHLKQKSKS